MAGHVEEHQLRDQLESSFLASLPMLTSLDESLEQEQKVEEKEELGELVKKNEEVEDTEVEVVEVEEVMGVEDVDDKEQLGPVNQTFQILSKIVIGNRRIDEGKQHQGHERTLKTPCDLFSLC